MNRQYCTFYIADRHFGVEITDVKEVQPPARCTPVFHAAEAVKGFVNIRGNIHLVIDLRTLLGFERIAGAEDYRIILFKPHVGESFGILVDGVGDVAEVDPARIENLGDRGQEVQARGLEDVRDLITGICMLKDRLLILLNAPKLLKSL